MAWIDQRGSEVLTRNECQRLLNVRAGGVGRVGLVNAGQVVIEPVNYRMFDADIVIKVGPGSILDAARGQAIVSFEVDQVSPSEGHAWSVLVQGLAGVIAGDDLQGARPADAIPLVPEPGSSFVRIRTGVLTGRRFRLRATNPLADAAPAGTPPADAPLSRLALRPPTRLGRDASIRQVAAAMEDDAVSAVVLGEHPAWLVTEHDLAGALAAGMEPDAPAAGVATKSPIWATTSSTVADAAALMAAHGVRHLIVVTPGGEPVGTLGLIDMIASLLQR